MEKYRSVRKQRSHVHIGDMTEVVTIETRAVGAPAAGDSDPTQTFATLSGSGAPWACVRPVTGVVLFDGVNTEIPISHEVWMRYQATVTAQHWIKRDDGTRLRIRDVKRVDERTVYTLALCTERGDDDAEAAHV